MRKDKVSKERKELEGAFLSARLDELQSDGMAITQDSIADDCGVSQGLVGQWLTGRTNVPDSRIKKLSEIMKFDPLEFRPSYKDMLINDIGSNPPFDYNLLNPSNQKIIDGIAEMLIDSQKKR